MLIDQRPGRQRKDPNLGRRHDAILFDHRSVVQVAAGHDSRAGLATDTASLADTVQWPSKGSGKDPGRLLACSPSEFAAIRVAHGTHVPAVIGKARAALGPGSRGQET